MRARAFGRRFPRLDQVAAALGLALTAGAGVLLWHTYWGDPTIYLSYARRIAAGDLFAFNAGEFSSGATSPLWAGILSLPYLIGLGRGGARVLACVLTLAAFVAVLASARLTTPVRWSAAIAALFVVEGLALYGNLMYETPLVVALVAGSLLAGCRLMTTVDTGTLRFRSVVPLMIIWAALPLARPDAAALVVLQWAAMSLYAGRRATSLRRTLALAAVLVAIPSLVYFGASWLTLGTVSLSARARAFGLREAADAIGPIAVSMPAMAYLGSILYALIPALIGLQQFSRDPQTRWLGMFGLGGLLTYVVMLVFIQPVTSDVPRYFLPMGPIVVIGAANVLSRWGAAGAAYARIGAALLAAVFVGTALISVPATALEQRRRGYTFDEIVERDIVEHVNAIARPGDAVLAYEMQDRYYLRDDVTLVSLEGLTDGRIHPYLETSDFISFLKHLRPTFWIANRAVEYRPFLRRSLFNDVVARFSADPRLTRFAVDGITFRLVRQRHRPMPRGFAGWVYLFAISYED